MFAIWTRRAPAPRRLPSKSSIRPTLEALEARDVPAIYEVGFGQAYTSIGAVPWTSLTAGDTVHIHWRSAAQGGDYHEKINISGQGTAAAPIQIIGVPGPNGELPVINGANATTSANDPTAYLGHQTRGLITITRSSINQDFNFYKPLYITIDGLNVENANPSYSFTNSSGQVVSYAQNAAAIYIERGSNITIRNSEIHNSGNGFFAGSNDYATNGGDGGMIRDVLFEKNYVHDNGTPGGYSEHNIYTEGVNFTFQYNRLGPLLPTALGANLKDRSAGTIIRYNDIYGGAHLLDLVHAQESASITTKLPSYRETYVYGNTLRAGPGETGTMVHYGGDDPGNTQDFRKGTLYFYDNTVIVQKNQSDQYQSVVFQLATNDESADIRDNVFYHSAAVGAPAGTTPSWLTFAANGDNAGQYHFGVNWVSPDWHGWYNDDPPASGLIDGTANFLTNAANNPGFANLAAYDLHPAPGSALIDKGQPLAPAAAASNPVTRQYVVPQSSAARPVNVSASDLGAFEGAGVAVPMPGRLQFAASGYSVNEAAGTITITVSRTGGSSGAVMVDYMTANGTATAGQDYTAVSGTLAWTAGDASSRTIVVPILDDALVEGNEAFSIALSNPTGGATLGSPTSAAVTIVDNDSAPTPTFGSLQLSANAYSVNEAAGTITITVTRTGGSDGPVSIHYATGGGTATAGSDYTAASGTVSWAAGDASAKTFTIPIVDDAAVEGNEAVSIALSSPTGGATLGSPASATLTIVDNDMVAGPSTFQFSSPTYSVLENAGNVTITVTRTGNSAAAATVKYATVDLAGDPNVAWSSGDYKAASGKLTFAAGETQKTITVTMIDDTKVESNEVFGINLSNPTGGATLGTTSSARVTIVENDSSVQFGQARFDVTEGTAFATITVTRLGNTSGTATVNYKMQGETAYAGQDFIATSGQLVFGPGETTKTFTIKIVDDHVKEPVEQLALQLTNPTGGAILGDNIWSRLFITDND